MPRRSPSPAQAAPLRQSLEITPDDVRRAMQQPRPGLLAHALMWPRRPLAAEPPLDAAHGRDAAVLLLVYPIGGELYLVLTQRTETVQSHKGQISLPGGAHEGQESLEETALREAHEELAIPAAGLEILGRLTSLYVGVSGYMITPVVALTDRRPQFRPDPIEVVEAIEVPLALLLDPDVRREEGREVHGVAVQVPYFAIDRHKVWGATAMILAEFADLLETARQ